MQIYTVSEAVSYLEKVSSLLDDSSLFEFLSSIDDMTLIRDNGAVVKYDRNMASEIFSLFCSFERLSFVTDSFKDKIVKLDS